MLAFRRDQCHRKGKSSIGAYLFNPLKCLKYLIFSSINIFLDLISDRCIIKLERLIKDQLNIPRFSSGNTFHWYCLAKKVYPLSPADH